MSGIFNKDWQTVLREKDERITELEQENERLRAECGLRQIQGYHEGMEQELEQERELMMELQE